MKIHNDLLGLALMDFYSGKHDGKIIIHSPDFDEDEIKVEWYFRDFPSMPYLEKKALEFCYGKTLDVGAGAGSHSLFLQDKGLDIYAMDISAGACNVMRSRGISAVIQGDIFQLTSNKWDTILMMMNGIGVFGNINNLDAFLEKLPSLLNPGGQLLFDSTNLIYLFENEQGEIEIDLNREYYGQISFQLEYRDLYSPKFDWLYMDYDTLSSMADSKGLHTELLATGENYHYLARIRI